MIRADDGSVSAIVEEKDADAGQRAITEINVGMYAFDGALLGTALKQVTTDNAKGEEYLTDVVTILRDSGHRVGGALDRHWLGPLGVNDRVQLAEARRLLNDRVLEAHMRQGVTVVDPLSTWVDVQVTIEPDAVIEPGTQLRGATHIAAGARVGPGCTLTDTTVGEDAVVANAVCEGAEIGPEVSVGPFAYLRPGTKLARGAKAGTYVEMKNAVVGEGTKVPHLTYVGDAEIGVGSNIGAACVFVNYDGVEKHKSVVGDHVRVGSDNMLVAPVRIGDGAYTAAGSVITGDVPPGAMAVARARQRNVEGWVERRRPGTPAAEAARRAQERAEQGD
jgi:bifunctional UDP-N-acetylglucosamine pyrophosphorylase/glucosamine-1-phosphate N-acetyltransferase